MKKIFVAILCMFSLNLNAQFNTVRYKKDVPTVSVNKSETEYLNTSIIKANETLNSYKGNFFYESNASLPISNPIINSKYGERRDPFNSEKRTFHHGIDFQANKDSVLSVLPGIVKKTGADKKLGNYIEIEHGDFTSIYGHLSRISVKPGQMLDAGDFLGITGNTGKSTGEHLHFAMKYLNQWIDPEPILDYIFELITYVKTDFSDEVENALKRR
jgi:murein DD-endopeptidase MepM/ murein hydrolase activator NlpD